MGVDSEQAEKYHKKIKSKIETKKLEDKFIGNGNNAENQDFKKRRKKKKQSYTLNSKNTLKEEFENKNNKDKLSQSQQNISKIIIQQENLEEFKDAIEINPIKALNNVNKLPDDYKQEAVQAVLDKLNDEQILFSDDKGNIVFNTKVDKDNKPNVYKLLANGSKEQQSVVINRISEHAKSIIPLAFQPKIQQDALSGLSRLAAITDTDNLVNQKLLSLILDLKNVVYKYTQETKLPSEVINNEVLKEQNAIEVDLSGPEIIKLASSFNKKVIDDIAMNITDPKHVLITRIYEAFKLQNPNIIENLAGPPPFLRPLSVKLRENAGELYRSFALA